MFNRKTIACIVISLALVNTGWSAEEEAAPVIVTGTFSGPGVSENGANDYSVTSHDIINLPRETNTSMTDVLAQMPRRRHRSKSTDPHPQYRRPSIPISD